MGKFKSARDDMKEDGRIDDLKLYSKEMAIRVIDAFDENFDKGAIKNIEDLRKKPSAQSKRIVKKYDEAKKIVDALRKKYNL